MIQPFSKNSNSLVSNLEYELVTYMRKRRNRFIPKFQAISLAKVYRTSEYSSDMGLDGLALLLGLSKPAQQVFLELYYNRDNDGISIISSKTKTATEKVKFSKAYSELKQNEIAIKIKKNHYLLNPRIIIDIGLYDNLCNVWDGLKP